MICFLHLTALLFLVMPLDALSLAIKHHSGVQSKPSLGPKLEGNEGSSDTCGCLYLYMVHL